MTKMEIYPQILKILQDSYQTNPAITKDIFNVLYGYLFSESDRINFSVNFGRDTVITNLHNLRRINSFSMNSNKFRNAEQHILSIVRATVMPLDCISPVLQRTFVRLTFQSLCAEVSIIVGDLEFCCFPDKCPIMRTYTDSLTCVSHKKPQHCSCIDYCRHLLGVTVPHLYDLRIFEKNNASKSGADSFQPFIQCAVKRIHRILCHMHAYHFVYFVKMERETLLCTRFEAFSIAHGYMKESETVVSQARSFFKCPYLPLDNLLKSLPSPEMSASNSLQQKPKSATLPTSTSSSPSSSSNSLSSLHLSSSQGFSDYLTCLCFPSLSDKLQTYNLIPEQFSSSTPLHAAVSSSFPFSQESINLLSNTTPPFINNPPSQTLPPPPPMIPPPIERSLSQSLNSSLISSSSTPSLSSTLLSPFSSSSSSSSFSLTTPPTYEEVTAFFTANPQPCVSRSPFIYYQIRPIFCFLNEPLFDKLINEEPMEKYNLFAERSN